MWLPAGTNPAKEDLNSYIAGLMTDAGKLDPAKAPDTSDIRTHSKKMISTLSRELLKIRRNLMGIRDMIKVPDALVIVGPNKEHIAVKEAKRMGVTTIALIDTDSDPDPVDLPIPGNDDSIRSIEVIPGKLAESCLEGRAALPPEQQAMFKPRPPAKPATQPAAPAEANPAPAPAVS
jgi:small subunit ribosomal protein S2